jgi:hypothetical protein
MCKESSNTSIFPSPVGAGQSEHDAVELVALVRGELELRHDASQNLLAGLVDVALVVAVEALQDLLVRQQVAAGPKISGEVVENRPAG